MIYLNNAATSFPKPPGVIDAINSHLHLPPLESERGSSGKQNDVLSVCRRNIAGLFNIEDDSRIILNSGSTLSLNFAIQGMVSAKGQCHCLTSVQEHNSVLRPLNHLIAKHLLSVTYLPTENIFDTHKFEAAIQPNTRFVILSQISNVTGTILPLPTIAEKCEKHNLPLIIDASQSGGLIEIDVRKFPQNIILIFAGHKGLLGPMGTGGFYIGEGIVPFEPLTQGGTGIRSDLLMQPNELPLLYESGTKNLPGLAGLAAGVQYVLNQGTARISAKNRMLLNELKNILLTSPKIKIYEPVNGDCSAGILSFNIEGWSPADVGMVLFDSFDIYCRTGLHCAPMIHKEMGTWPNGTVRLSCSGFTTMDEITKAGEAILKIARAHQ